jgi:hypothetical protein
MKSEEIYNAWKERKSQIDIRENFSDELMNQIYRYESEKRKPLFNGHRLIELISTRPLGKAAVVTAGAAIGLVRVMIVIYAFLAC